MALVETVDFGTPASDADGEIVARLIAEAGA